MVRLLLVALLWSPSSFTQQTLPLRLCMSVLKWSLVKTALTLGAQVLGDSPLPLYIATKKVNKTRFASLHDAYPQIVYLSDVLDEVLPGVNPMYLGPIEQVQL